MLKKLLLPVFLICSLVCGAQVMDVQHYRFELQVSDHSNSISGKASITIAFLSGVSEVVLDLASSDGSYGFEVSGVKEAEQVLSIVHRHDRLNITLIEPAKKGDTHTYEISYHGTPKDGLIISRNKYTKLLVL